MERFNKVCRTCNTERPNLIELSAEGLRNQGLATLTWHEILFTVCPSLPIRDENKLPQKICNVCTKRLEIAYVFQLQCLQSDRDLWNCLKEGVVKAEQMPVDPVVECDLNQLTYLEEDCPRSDHTPKDDLQQDYIIEDDDGERVSENDTESREDPLPTNTQKPDEVDAPFFCCYCDKKYHTIDGLRFHEKLSHKNVKPVLVKAEILTIECKYCRQVFERKNELILHCRAEHKTELADDLTCNMCQKSFTRKNKLEHHLLYHANSKYQCPVKSCRRDFVIKYKLTDHMKRFHGISLNNFLSNHVEKVDNST